jgi:SPP1 family predicted phage head-tail adaptor
VTFDNELTLFSISYSYDEIGNSIETKQGSTVLCEVQSITRSEHYAAASSGLKPEIVFVVNQYDYAGQKEVEFEKVIYKVIRTYKANKGKGLGDFETIELVCQGVENLG